MKWLGLIHNPTVKEEMQEIHDRSEAEDSLKVGKKKCMGRSASFKVQVSVPSFLLCHSHYLSWHF